MGRNYESELQFARSTVEWASSLDLSATSAAFGRLRCRDLVVIASGGSVAAAQLLAQLHTHRSGHLSAVMTPLEFIADTQTLEATALFLSSGGGNNDILQAWHSAAARGIQDVAVLCGNSKSPLASLANEAQVAASTVFDLPTGRDGFLATNSLVAFFVIILRLYGVEIPVLPERPQLSHTSELLERDTLVILYGGWLKSVAIDLESRFTEAALGSVQIADYRNFAHGRHHWLAKRGANAAVLALISPTFFALANDTLKEIPPEVRVERWSFEKESPAIALLGLQQSMELAGIAAARHGYDAGRPGVPEFGEHIYDLTTPPQPPLQSLREIAISRKLRACGVGGEHTLLLEQLSMFEEALYAAKVTGIVLDYDGTIVATSRRFEAIEPEMASELNRLLSSGLLLGIATGRGKSVHTKLRAAISPDHWSRCIVGYYNGSTIRSLADHCEGLANCATDPAISSADSLLRRAPELATAKFETRPLQITVAGSEFDEHGLWMKVCNVLERSDLAGLRVMHSSHSVDVVPNHVSKATFVEHFAKRAGTVENAILKIGDRGRWPGNDSDLLAMSHGLSVDQVSGSPGSCWNLAPRGISGPTATLYYLRNIQLRRYKAS